MAEVKILVEGFAKQNNNSWEATSNTVLIRDGEKLILVDPGIHRKLLLDALKKEDIKVEDIDFVVLTHYHLDHSLLAGIFLNAKILDDTDVYSWDGKIKEHNGKNSWNKRKNYQNSRTRLISL